MEINADVMMSIANENHDIYILLLQKIRASCGLNTMYNANRHIRTNGSKTYLKDNKDEKSATLTECTKPFMFLLVTTCSMRWHDIHMGNRSLDRAFFFLLGFDGEQVTKISHCGYRSSTCALPSTKSNIL